MAELPKPQHRVVLLPLVDHVESDERHQWEAARGCVPHVADAIRGFSTGRASIPGSEEHNADRSGAHQRVVEIGVALYLRIHHQNLARNKPRPCASPTGYICAATSRLCDSIRYARQFVR